MIQLTFGFQYTTSLVYPLALLASVQIALILFLMRLIKFYEFQMVSLKSTTSCTVHDLCVYACQWIQVVFSTFQASDCFWPYLA